jgi:hypothetical protein
VKLLERLVGRVERWIESIDRERDELARAMAAVQAGEFRSALHARMAVLEEQRVQAVQRLLVLVTQRSWEELMFARRPRPMAKASLRADLRVRELPGARP